MEIDEYYFVCIYHIKNNGNDDEFLLFEVHP